MFGKLNHITQNLLSVTIPLLLVGCSDDLREFSGSDDVASVTFMTTLDADMQTRTGLNVDKVVCAVFEVEPSVEGSTTYTEITNLRETFQITDGESIMYSPLLVKGLTYKVVFWAMNGDNYDATDLTNISPEIAEGGSFTGDPVKYECFTNSKEFTVSGSLSESILLTRPMARINLGISDEDMQAVTQRGYTPTKVELSLSVPQSYNALCGKSCGAVQTLTMTLPVSENGSLSVNGTTYNAMASYMVFTDGSNIDLTYKVYGTNDGSEEVIVSNTIKDVPVGVNKNTNIVGIKQ